MEAIRRLERAGLTIADICAVAKVGPPAIRRWKRGETSPSASVRELLIQLAEAKGVLLLGSDFTREPAKAPPNTD